MTSNSDEVIEQIMQDHPEADWLQECRAALPDADDGYILSVIEILSGGDLVAVE